MKPRVFIKRSSKPISRSAVKKKPRPKSETLRIYGGKKRIEFVKSLACQVCAITGYTENAHIETGGMGRKADSRFIMALCGPHPRRLVPGIHIGHHRLLHKLGRETFERRYDLNLSACAAETEKLWQDHINEERA